MTGQTIDEEKKREAEEAEKQEGIPREYDTFCAAMMPWDSSGVRAAVSVFIDAGLDGDELADVVKQYMDDYGVTELDKIDVCAVAYEHLFQQARNKISEVLDFDVCNDIEGSQEFYVAGNYMCTSIDYPTNAQEQLQEKLNEETDDQRDDLKNDEFVVWFIDQAGLTLDKPDEDPEDKEDIEPVEPKVAPVPVETVKP